MTSHHVKYIPSDDTLWEFSAPGYCDFSVPYIPLPDDGYFDPCLLENADGFDRYPAPPTPQGPIAAIPSTPGTRTELIIEPPLSIPRSAARRIATSKTTITNMHVDNEGNTLSLISTHVNAPLPQQHNTFSLLREDDYSDLKSPVRPIKGAWLQHVMAIAQNSASSSVVESTTFTSCETENIALTSISAPVESNESNQPSEPQKNEEEVSITTSTLSPNVLLNGGIPRSPRIQVSGILSAASPTHTFIQEEVSKSNVVDKETFIDDKLSSTSTVSVQFTFSPQLVKEVEEDAQVFFQTTSETIAPLSSLDEIDLKITIPLNQTTPVSVLVPENMSKSEDESTATLVTASISVPIKSTSLMQMTKTRVISSGHTSSMQQQQKKASVPITSKSSGVIPPPQPPSSQSTHSSTSQIKKSALAATKSTASTSASSALAAFKQRTAALAAKVFASANVANATTQEMRPPPSGVAQFIASTSPSKKTIKSTVQSTVEATQISVPPVLPSTTTGQTSGARRVPKAEPTSMISTLSSALVPTSVSVAAPLPGSGFVPVQQPTTSFVPTALLLAKYESGVRDLIIPTITAAGSKPSTSNTVNKKTDVQPFTFATAGRANRRKSADASLAPAAMAAIAASASDGLSHHHYQKQQSSDSQQRTMSALASKRTMARVPSTLQEVSSSHPTETTTIVPLEPVNAVAMNPIISAPQIIAPTLLMPHKLGEIPDAVKRAARIAQEERTAGDSSNTHSTATVTISEASITTAGGGAQGRLERFHGLLNKMGRTFANASTVPVVAVSVPTSKENVLVSKPRSLLPLPTVAKSPLLHTKRRTLERAQQQN